MTDFVNRTSGKINGLIYKVDYSGYPLCENLKKHNFENDKVY